MNINLRIAQDLERYADMLENSELVFPDEMNCASLMRLAAKTIGDGERLEPVAYQSTSKPNEIVSAEEWENIDTMWHWMYRPLFTKESP
jgi:hypothetical protein